MSKLSKFLNILCVAIIVLGAGYYFLEPKLSKNKIINDVVINEPQSIIENQKQGNIEQKVEAVQNQNSSKINNVATGANTNTVKGGGIADWKLYSYNTDNFSIKFPSEPKITEKKESKDGGELLVRSFESSADTADYTLEYDVVYTDFPDVVLEPGHPKRMSEEDIFLWHTTFMKFVYKDKVTFSNTTSKSTIYEIKIPGKQYYKGFIIVNRDKLYGYGASCDKCATIPNIDEYIASFKFMK